jgi:hypothetical protein
MTGAAVTPGEPPRDGATRVTAGCPVSITVTIQPLSGVVWQESDQTIRRSLGRSHPDLRKNASNSPAWNGSRYHDLAVHLSVLIQEQILTRDPADFSPDEIRIRRPADRLAEAAAWWLAAALRAPGSSGG